MQVPGLIVMQHYLNYMCVFTNDANDKRMLWKSKKEKSLERALEKASTLSFPGVRSPCLFLVINSPSVICHRCCKRCLSVKIIPFDTEEPQDRRRGLSVGRPNKTVVNSFPCSVLFLLSCFVCLPASVSRRRTVWAAFTRNFTD